MISLYRSPSPLHGGECMSRAAWPEKHDPTAVQARRGSHADPPRGPFGGGNRVASGTADGGDDELLQMIDVLLGGLHPGPDGDVGIAATLRAALAQAREACEQGRTGLARYIVELVRGR